MAYQLEGYKELFGDPYAATNEKNGHKVVDKKGQKWVIVPATSDPTVPCRIQISDIQRITKTKDLFNTENADQDLGDDGGQTADRVFDEAVGEAEEEFAEMCTGIAFDQLQEELQNVGGRERGIRSAQ